MHILKRLKDNLNRNIDTVFGNSQLFSNMGYMPEGRIGTESIEDSYRSLFFRCLQMRANRITTAFKKMQVERVLDQGETEKVDPDQPWVQLLRRPLASMDADTIYRTISLNVDLIGHMDLAVQRTNGIPSGLIPIFRQFGEVWPQPNKQGEVEGWVFRRNDGDKVELDRDEIIRDLYSETDMSYSDIGKLPSVDLLKARVGEIVRGE